MRLADSTRSHLHLQLRSQNLQALHTERTEHTEPTKRWGPAPYMHPICTCNKVCTCIPVPSDREVKEAFETTDPLLILQKLSELPIQSWNYKWNNSSIRHIGPTAQDFAAAFAVGEDDKQICPVDAQGVAFAAIQGLYQIIKEKEAGTESLQGQLQRQQEKNETLNARIEALERLVKDAAVITGCRARIWVSTAPDNMTKIRGSVRKLNSSGAAQFAPFGKQKEKGDD